MAFFDKKAFDGELFGKYVARIPEVRKAEFINSGVFVGNAELDQMFTAGSGTAYARIPLYGLLGGEPVNYDGNTDITSEGTTSMDWGVVVVGRAKAWREYDFAYDITGGVDFMDNVAAQVSNYWDLCDQKTVLSILKGAFSMAETDFTDNHSNDVTANGDGKVTAATLNETIQYACGDNKDAFTLVIMHSAVATNLENLNLLNYAKYTDEQGIERNMALAYWNGRRVLVDDSVPVETEAYTTYVLGEGAFAYKDVGAKVPYEMDRNPASKGGEDVLYTRQRKVFAPYGISYKKAEQASLSPTLAELEAAANWELVNDGTDKINHRAIPIARIVSKG